jgi:hypothetical protein
MVFVPGLPDLSVTINVNDRPLQEYNADNNVNRRSGIRHITKYVAATAGSEFKVVANYGDQTKTAFAHGMRHRVKIDGNIVESLANSSTQVATQRPSFTVSKMQTKEGDKFYDQNFMFGDLVLSKK